MKQEINQLVRVGNNTYRYQSDPSAANWTMVCRVENGLDWHATGEEKHMIKHHVAGHPYTTSFSINDELYFYRLNPDGTEQVTYGEDLIAHPHEARQVFRALAAQTLPTFR